MKWYKYTPKPTGTNFNKSRFNQYQLIELVEELQAKVEKLEKLAGKPKANQPVVKKQKEVK